LGFVLTVANGLITAIIITGMAIDGTQVWRAILTGAAYFAITSVAFAALITGSASSIFLTWQHQKTERHRVDAYEHLAELALSWHIEAARAQQPQLAAPQEQGPQRVYRTLSVTDSFVPPYQDPHRASTEALAWVRTLYGSDGFPDRRKVVVEGDNYGWLKVKMLGSNRGDGSRDALQWLLDRRVVMRAQGGFVVNLSRYPTQASLAQIR
jgi:hypothetical protein